MKWKTMLVVVSVALNVGVVGYLIFAPAGTSFLLPESFAQNRAVAGGGYVATTADVSSTRQALYVVDNREKRMLVYSFPSGKGGLKVIGALDLRSAKAFGETLAGDVMLVPGRVASTTEAVYIIDPVGKQMIAVASKGKKVEIVGAAKIGDDFTRAGGR